MKDRKSLIKKGMIISKTLLFRFLLIRAGGFLRHPERIIDTANNGIKRLRSYDGPGEMAGDAINTLQTLLRMLRAYGSGEYKGLETKKVLLILGSVLYFLSPIDLIPDAIPFMGWLDDLSLFAWVLQSLHVELREFKAWEHQAQV